MAIFPVFILLWILFCAPAKAGDEPLSLAPDKTAITVPEAAVPQVRTAAALLRTWLRKAAGSGGGFDFAPVGGDSAAKAEVAILLDDNRELGQSKLSPDGFVLKRVGNKIYISGATPAGTFFGAVEFLNRLGIRFYMPTDLFTSLPEPGDLRVGDLDVASSPWVQSLFFSGIDGDDVPGVAWARINGVWRRKGGTHQHNSFAMFPPERYADRYPEIYPILDGKRYIPKVEKDQSWQPNYAEPKLVDAALESIDLYFAKHPADGYVALSGQDGSRYDEGPKTEAVIETFRQTGVKNFKERALSSLYWSFMAEVATKMKAKWPDKLLVGLAYGSTRFPPAEKLPGNVVVFTNFHIAELPSDGFLREENGGNPTLGAWLKVCSHYGNHDWYQGAGYFIPRIYSSYWSRFLREAQARVGDAFMHVETYPNWGFDGPKYYILSRLMWNPKADPEALVDQMCHDLFGPGADAMSRYFKLLDALWNELSFNEKIERKLAAWRVQGRTAPASRAMIAEARKLLDEALSKVSKPEQAARIELFSDCFRVSEYFFEFAGADSFRKGRLDEAVAFCEATLRKHGKLAAHHPSRLVPALKEVATFALRSTAQVIKPPMLAMAGFPPPQDGKAWSKALRQADFFLDGGAADPQKTTLRCGRDEKYLYIQVNAPRLTPREFVETDDSNWRSDNIEFKFDLDRDWSGVERQFWVKTNGRLVDWSGKDRDEETPLKAAVTKGEGEYGVVCRIPFSYLSEDASVLSNLGVQVFRNEFSPDPGMNRLSYQAVWSKRLNLNR